MNPDEGVPWHSIGKRGPLRAERIGKEPYEATMFPSALARADYQLEVLAGPRGVHAVQLNRAGPEARTDGRRIPQHVALGDWPWDHHPGMWIGIPEPETQPPRLAGAK